MSVKTGRMEQIDWKIIDKAWAGAIEVLLHNALGPFDRLPRTAGWGYPEPYTRDLLLSVLGIGVSGNQQLLESMQRVLETLAENQSLHGHIPSLVHDQEDRGASDTTPLFLLALGIFRKISGKPDFLESAAERAMTWMDYQRPTDSGLVAQQPTSDWRDEQWVLGYGLYVNTLTYAYLRLFDQEEKAAAHRQHLHEGLLLENKPYYALWSYKVYSSDRFDLLGNSLAILSGIASPSRAKEIVSWIEKECTQMKQNGLLAVDLPPNFFPFIRPEDADWIPRYEFFNLPGDYHNGGIWPFILGFYIAALVAAGAYTLAEEKLMVLTRLIEKSADKSKNLNYGFNEWLKAQTGQPAGQDWQSWSAAMYLYAVACVKNKSTPFFEDEVLF